MSDEDHSRISVSSLMKGGRIGTPEYEQALARYRRIAESAARDKAIAEGLHLKSEGARLLLEDLPTLNPDDRERKLVDLLQLENEIVDLLRKQDAARAEESESKGE